ncbi:MAG TPA: ribosome biogenesis GTP-binding protein YihA/YsxC [Burkholderiaceae bacterium]|nr:ribosome biogenesis GTP-binding protein YihA/YsxC [Burkholderiaceae bacterium]
MTLFESAQFSTSVASFSELNAAPLAMLPEVAFVGRSNAGKSSVINTLAKRRQLAYASKTPGRTQLLNFFQLSERASDGTTLARAYAVDLPGYGFAKVDASKRAEWDELAGGYLATRRYLVGVVLVMDARRPLVQADEVMLAWLSRRDHASRMRVHLLLNKADQLNRAERTAALRSVEQRIAVLPLSATAQLFSARTRDGIEQLRETLDRIIAEARPG